MNARDEMKRSSLVAALSLSAAILLGHSARADDETLLMAKVDASGQQVCKVDYKDPTDPSNTGLYMGQCEAGQPEGVGKVLFRNGDRFEGQFKRGIAHGSGTWYGASGDSYRGQWQQGVRAGEGTYRWASGGEYVGSWQDDKRQGRGVYTWANGNRFEGEFVDNRHYNGVFYTQRGGVHRCRAGNCR